MTNLFLGFILGVVLTLISIQIIKSTIEQIKEEKLSKEDKFILHEVPDQAEELLKIIKDDLILKTKIGKTARKKLFYYFEKKEKRK